MSTQKLLKYKKKRDFARTPEPQPLVRNSHTKSIFVVQKHKASNLHYDLRLEYEGVLKSWAIPKGPSLNPNVKHLAIKVEDHPLEYANFEGVIPQNNYGAGKVIVWDKGNLDFVHIKGPKGTDGIMEHAESISFMLHGRKLKGEFILAKLSRSKKNEWLFFKKKDRQASTDSKLDERSVLSGKTVESLDTPEMLWLDSGEINLRNLPKTNFPSPFRPMLSGEADEPFDDPEYIFEIKWDGYRALAFKDKSRVNIYSRNLSSLNKKFNPIVVDLTNIKESLVLDGEMVAFSNLGIHDFQILQSSTFKPSNIVYYVFDLLYLDGRNLQNLSLINRKNLLNSILQKYKLNNVRFSDHVQEHGEELFNLIGHKFEGIIAKRRDGLYRPGTRTNDWLKIKSFKSLDAFIVGYLAARDSRPFGSLALARKSRGKLQYIGNVGTGFNEDIYRDIKNKLSPVDEYDLLNRPKLKLKYVDPKLIAEIKYREITRDGLLRHPVFLRLKDRYNEINTNLRPINMESETFKVSDKQIEISHPEKVFWPELKITKHDLVEYYASVADYILPHLKDRPESLNRHPDGIKGLHFFQKNIDFEIPEFAQKIKVRSKENTVNYLLCQNIKSLLYIVNLGCIEINPWLSRKGSLSKPDFMVLDFDPQDIDFKYVVKSILATKKILDKANLSSYVKTSGATGMHIYIPLASAYSYKLVRNFAKIIAKLVNDQCPKFTSIERLPKNRKGKVYIDYLQNSKGQTLACAYSVRPNEFAGVSTPLAWSEINEKLDPKKLNIFTTPQRLNEIGDIFKPTLSEKNDLQKALSLLEK